MVLGTLVFVMPKDGVTSSQTFATPPHDVAAFGKLHYPCATMTVAD
jgi:hypothetical protein